MKLMKNALLRRKLSVTLTRTAAIFALFFCYGCGKSERSNVSPPNRSASFFQAPTTVQYATALPPTCFIDTLFFSGVGGDVVPVTVSVFNSTPTTSVTGYTFIGSSGSPPNEVKQYAGSVVAQSSLGDHTFLVQVILDSTRTVQCWGSYKVTSQIPLPPSCVLTTTNPANLVPGQSVIVTLGIAYNGTGGPPVVGGGFSYSLNTGTYTKVVTVPPIGQSLLVIGQVTSGSGTGQCSITIRP